MIVKITSKRQVTLPERVVEALGAGPADQLELNEGPDGFTIRPRRITWRTSEKPMRSSNSELATSAPIPSSRTSLLM